ncbi:MAG TPA: glycosyltransferase, partial [Solirubrobacteraceae bacterium]|nr:glycosyltransferase [Solirubrobacteraceae bacterium]
MEAAFVVITRDRWAALAATVGRLRARHPSVPIVVVDNGSERPAPPLGPGVELVRCAADLGAAARNAGAERAGTDLVAFCDDDA